MVAFNVGMIIVVGLSPACQQLLVFDRLAVGEVNRAKEVHWFASGKAINGGSLLANLQCDHMVLTPVGGSTGAQLRSDCQRRQIQLEAVSTEGATRVCSSLVEPGGIVTELVPEAPTLTATELDAFRAAYSRRVKNASVVVLTGSLPVGVPRDFYAELLHDTHCPSVVDARGPELLACLALRPTIVKPNRLELEKTVSRKLDSEAAIVAASKELIARGAQNVVVTNGPKAVYGTTAAGHWTAIPPRIQPVNPIGSGDCLAAAMAWALSKSSDLGRALRVGIAAAALNAESLLSVTIRCSDLEKSADRVDCRFDAW